MAALAVATSAFITLEDLAFKMPGYAEHTLFVERTTSLTLSAGGWKVRRATRPARRETENHSPLGEYRQARLATWDIPRCQTALR